MNYITIISLIFGISMLLAFLLVYINQKRQPLKKTELKGKVFTGGELINEEEMQLPSEKLFWPIRRFFKIDALKEKHTGNLSDYLAWLLLALVLITLLLLGVYI